MSRTYLGHFQLRFDPHFLVVAVLTISKHYISQWYIVMDPLTSLRWFVSYFHWLPSNFHTPDVCGRHNWLIFIIFWTSFYYYDCFNHIQRLKFSIIHSHRPFNKFRVVYLSTFHWLPSNFHTPKVHVIDTTG